MRDGDLMPEIKRHTALGWAAFGKVDNIMRSRKASMKIQRKVVSDATWALTTAQMDVLAVAQRKMERIMLDCTALWPEA